MIKFLLSPEQGFDTYFENGKPKLTLCTDPLRLKRTPDVGTWQHPGKAGILYHSLKGVYGVSIRKDHLKELYYPLIVAIRLFAYETAGFIYNRSDVIFYIAWHFYGQEVTEQFIDDTLLAFFMIKEYESEINLTLHSNVFEPVLPWYQSLHNRYGKEPKYWGKTITEENELDFLFNPHDYLVDKEGRVSKGEQMAMDYFEKNGIEFIYDTPVDYVPQFCNQECIRPDFILPELDVVVEIHGTQHLSFNKGFHVSYDDFVQQQLRDVDMRKFCHENGYTLIEIPFSTKENIAEKLARALHNIMRKRKRRKSNEQ